jgi:hypothetical protein
MDHATVAAQREVCAKHGAVWMPAHSYEKVGIAANVRTGLLPINGMRHEPAVGTTGWYIWAGEELSADPEFFLPLHVSHLPTWAPAVLRFLGLPPGWRFLIADDYEDVWSDVTLLGTNC